MIHRQPKTLCYLVLILCGQVDLQGGLLSPVAVTQLFLEVILTVSAPQTRALEHRRKFLAQRKKVCQLYHLIPRTPLLVETYLT